MDDAAEITVLQLPKFKQEATDLIGTEGIEALAAHLAEHPDAWGRDSRCLIRCYAKNVKTDLTPGEKNEVRQIAANLKGTQ